MRVIDRFRAAPQRLDAARPRPAEGVSKPYTDTESLDAADLIAPMNGFATEAELRSSPRRARLLLAVQLTVLALILTGSSAHAETVQVLALAASVDEVLTNVRNWIMGILAGLATVCLSVGGVRRVLGGGDPGEVEKAKAAFRSAAWGYGGAALAPLVVEILKGIVGA
jgi:hypothetical protein